MDQLIKRIEVVEKGYRETEEKNERYKEEQKSVGIKDEIKFWIENKQSWEERKNDIAKKVEEFGLATEERGALEKVIRGAMDEKKNFLDRVGCFSMDDFLVNELYGCWPEVLEYKAKIQEENNTKTALKLTVDAVIDELGLVKDGPKDWLTTEELEKIDSHLILQQKIEELVKFFDQKIEELYWQTPEGVAKLKEEAAKEIKGRKDRYFDQYRDFLLVKNEKIRLSWSNFFTKEDLVEAKKWGEDWVKGVTREQVNEWYDQNLEKEYNLAAKYRARDFLAKIDIFSNVTTAKYLYESVLGREHCQRQELLGMLSKEEIENLNTLEDDLVKSWGYENFFTGRAKNIFDMIGVGIRTNSGLGQKTMKEILPDSNMVVCLKNNNSSLQPTVILNSAVAMEYLQKLDDLYKFLREKVEKGRLDKEKIISLTKDFQLKNFQLSPETAKEELILLVDNEVVDLLKGESLGRQKDNLNSQLFELEKKRAEKKTELTDEVERCWLRDKLDWLEKDFQAKNLVERQEKYRKDSSEACILLSKICLTTEQKKIDRTVCVGAENAIIDYKLWQKWRETNIQLEGCRQEIDQAQRNLAVPRDWMSRIQVWWFGDPEKEKLVELEKYQDSLLGVSQKMLEQQNSFSEQFKDWSKGIDQYMDLTGKSLPIFQEYELTKLAQTISTELQELVTRKLTEKQQEVLAEYQQLKKLEKID
jgi:hypothetical protein